MITLAVGLLACTPVHAATGILHEIKITGHADYLEVTDVDGDGKRDLIVSHHHGKVVDRPGAPKVTRFITVITFDEKHPRSRPVGVPLDATIAVVCDVLPEPGPEIVFLTRNGLQATNLRNPMAQRTELATLPLFFDLPARRLPLADLAADLDGDGRADLVVPTPDGYAMLLGKDLSKPVLLDGDVRQRARQEYASDHFVDLEWTLPKLAMADVTGDGDSELVYFLDQTLTIFEGGSSEAPTRRRDEDGASLGEAVQAGKDDSISRRRLLIADIDGDHRADILTSTNSGNITQLGSWGTRIGVFLNTGTGRPGKKPDSVVKVKGVSIPPRLVDHDGDGDLDLILSTVRTDLATGISAATLKKLTITYEVYAWEGKAYSRRPVVQRDIEVPLDGAFKGGGVFPFGYLHGDYDGDGKKDLLTLGDEQFLIFKGGVKSGGWFAKDDGFANQPTWTIPAPVTNQVEIADLDGDGRSEVIFLGSEQVVLWRPEGLR